MKWSDVLEDKSLRDLPYKVELNEHGSITMTPASNRHGKLQSLISHLLRNQMYDGDVISECSIQTDRGVKVADVAWMSDTFFKTHGDATPFPQAPEVCIEIVSPSNSKRELDEKVAVYFASGASEVWVCSDTGQITIYAAGGNVGNASTLFPEFPPSINS